MNQKFKNIPYYHSNKEEIIQLNYISNCCAYIILPKKEIKIDDYIKNLNSKNFTNLFNKLKVKSINLHLPKFKIECNYDLNLLLNYLGIKNSFEPTANFNKILKNENMKIYINKVLQKSYINVDEKGTEAAVVSAAIMTKRKKIHLEVDYIDVKFNRPFIFIICSLDKNLGQHFFLFITVIKQLKDFQNFDY